MKKIFILNIIFYNLFQNIIVQELCSKDIECENCQRCIITENTDVSCKYGNLFCKQRDNIYFLTDLKSDYINYYKQNSETSNLCGIENIILDTTISTKTIEIGKKINYYLKTNSLHCNYNINSLFYGNQYEIDISSSLLSSKKDNNPNNNNKLSFTIYFNFRESYNCYYTDNDIRNIGKILKITGFTIFSIMIDFDKINSENDSHEIEETLKIYIYITNLNNKKFPDNLNQKSDNEKEKKDYKILFIVGIVVISVIVIVAIVVKNCIKRRLYLERDGTNNINRVDITIHTNNKNKIDNRKKIESLFNTILHPMKYYKNILGNEYTSCSICLEYFLDKISIIILTPCNHIFHFSCLKKWGEENIEHFKCPNCNYDFLKEEENIKIKVEKRNNNKCNNNTNSNVYNNYITYTTNRNLNINTLRSNNNILFLNNNEA